MARMDEQARNEMVERVTRVGMMLEDISAVRRQNIWRRSRRKLAERGPRLVVDVKRRAYGVASADVRWSVA